MKTIRSTFVRQMTACALMCALIVVCSWIRIPGQVPFTMQTFAIFFGLMALGGKLGSLAVGVYLAIGMMGLPVFSNFGGGFGYILGATGGYLVGFLPMALLYWGLMRLFGRRRFSAILVCAVCLLFLYACGTIWFYAVFVSRGDVRSILSILTACVFPFILPDALKIALAAFLAKRLRKAGLFSWGGCDNG